MASSDFHAGENHRDDSKPTIELFRKRVASIPPLRKFEGDKNGQILNVTRNDNGGKHGEVDIDGIMAALSPKKLCSRIMPLSGARC